MITRKYYFYFQVLDQCQTELRNQLQDPGQIRGARRKLHRHRQRLQ